MPGSVSLPARQTARGPGEDERKTSACGPQVVLPVGMIDPSVPIRNIQMKFAVLDGLVQVGQVSDRDIVETVLNLLVGGEFDLETNHLIQEADGVLCMLDLLRRCPAPTQAQVWATFTAMLRRSLRNRHTCTQVGLVRHLLFAVGAADDGIAELLVELLCVLAHYSIAVGELKLLLTLLRGEQGGIWVSVPTNPPDPRPPTPPAAPPTHPPHKSGPPTNPGSRRPAVL
ncbi:unnamed protein product [Arctogadus glacialis]